MRVACALVQHFPFRMEVGRQSHLIDQTILIIQSTQSKRTILDTSPSIIDVPTGTPLQHALTRHPEALQQEADLAFYLQRFEEILTRLEHVSPVVQDAQLGCTYVGLDGLESMYQGQSGLLKALQEAIPPELEPRFGIGPGLFPSFVAAVSAEPGLCVIAPAKLAEFLAPHPLEVLPLSWQMRSRLRRLGLTCLGDIARQQLGSMQASFGPTGKRIWELSQGLDRTPLIGRKREPESSATMTFPTPTVAQETILLSLQALVVQLFTRLEVRGRFVRFAIISASIYRRPTWQRRVAFKEPIGDPARALPAFNNLLSLHPPPGPVEDLTLTLGGFTGEAARQGSLFIEVRHQEQLKEALRQLEVVMGKRPPIYQLKDAQPWSRIPEERRMLVPPSFL